MKITCLIGNSLSFLIGGEAGQGITRSGQLLGKAVMKGGFHVFGANDYPSVIRGGHNLYLLRVSDREVHSQDDKTDLILALNEETVLQHIHELNEKGGVIYDQELDLTGKVNRPDVGLYPVPLSDFVKEIGGVPIMRNTVAIGAAIALVGYDLSYLKAAIADAFPGRDKIIADNQKAAEMGYNYTKENYGESFPCGVEPSDSPQERIMLTGNDAVALGAIQAGCKFFSAYPMTPASPVLHYLINHDEETGMVVIQPESEISAINMTIGAAYTGVRAMTATSGGGFALMTESLGLAAITETPIVLMVGQRPGPSTGMATYSAQGDLLFTIYASQGEFPRVVIAPGDVDECFYLTGEAFNLAEKYQIPSIIITDKYLIESHKSTEPFKKTPINRGDLYTEETWTDDEYKRHKITESGISPRIKPGTMGAFTLSNSNEHDEYGYTTIDPEILEATTQKIMRKTTNLLKEVETLNPVKVYGPDDAEVTIVCWGSTKGPALEALEILTEGGIKTRLIQVVYIEPFPVQSFMSVIGKTDNLLLLEGNKTAQLGKIIKQNTGITFSNVYLRYDGRPFNPGNIAQKVKEAMK